jgi:toxin ParE1/3/4
VRVELHPEAEAEFAAEVEYYEARQSGLGQRFYRTVIKCIEWIAENPVSSRLRKNYRRVNLRTFRFYVAYAVEGDLIRVLAIAHVARKPEYWKSRMKK